MGATSWELWTVIRFSLSNLANQLWKHGVTLKGRR